MSSDWKVVPKSDNLDRILVENRQLAGKLLRKAGNTAVKEIKLREPVGETGLLRNSTEGEPGTLIFRIKIGAFYWSFLNEGTRYIAPMYFVEEGVNIGIGELHDALERYFKRRR